MSKWVADIEQLTGEELDRHVGDGTFRLAFIGMSNVGKSYRSRVLHNDLSFFWHHVDEEIQKKLGFIEIDEVSEWLGLPGTSEYDKREKHYITLEEQCTKLDALDTKGKNLVFDTTGSVIYLKKDVLDWLRNECLVIHLDIDEEHALRDMTERFFDHPKPVVWNGRYCMEEGESSQDTIRRCYPKLLEDRLQKYRGFAHLSIPHDEFYNKTAEETLTVIRKHLES